MPYVKPASKFEAATVSPYVLFVLLSLRVVYAHELVPDPSFYAQSGNALARGTRSGPTMSKPVLPEALSRDDADAELDDLRRR